MTDTRVASPSDFETHTQASPVRLRSIVGGLAGSDNPTVQLVNTAAIAAVGYIARPLGSWLIGFYADRRGRKAALTWSVLGMCIGSLMIAVPLPLALRSVRQL